MKLKYIVNDISITSIPWRWADFFNKNSSIINVEMMSLRDIKKNIFDIKHTVDIVHGHHIKAMAFFLVMNFLLRKKSVYTVHGSYIFLSKINVKLLRFILKYSDKIIFVNKMLYDVLPLPMKDLIKDKYEIILNGVEINYSYKKIDVYKKFNINENDTILFHPARFVTEKNHLRVVDALKLVVESNDKIKLVLAGNGKLKHEIEKRIKDLNLENHIMMLGLIERDEVYNFLERCDLFLMPSVSEGLNIAFLEAISMHSKVLVSNIEQFVYPVEVYELNLDDINVTFVDPLDEKSIALGIESALEKKKNLTYDSSDFSLGDMMHKYESIYKELLA